MGIKTRSVGFRQGIVLILTVVTLFVFPSFLRAGFDPVNDDTDLFLSNPNVTSDRPNVLIVLDNTANWNQPFVNEKNALVSVVANLNEIFNVGLMMFPETGGGNDNVDGGYVRFAIRQMTTVNKTVLSDMVANLDQLGDKGNNATTALAMFESYLYYAGLASRASFGKVKTDYDGNTANNPANVLGYHALPASPNASSLYRSPVSNGCQKNFIIYISNGPANENSHALSFSETKLATLTGSSPPNVISLTPNGQQGNWADEWAHFMANSDVNPTMTDVQNVYTYTLEVDPILNGQGPAMTALLQSMANKGKGRYFAVSSGNNGQAIVNALNQIFQEIQAVNSVFAATTLPVSVNVRGTNLNQVYVGMFRPDAQKLPRWYGNLKCYQLGLNQADGDLFLIDSSGIKAESSTTGFITTDAASFWTKSSTFWDFRTGNENGSGGDSDLPDGDLVEKGGVAQQLRVAHATSQEDRHLYSCTGSCTGGSALSAYPFKSDNEAITSASLMLDVQSVAKLTGLIEQPVTALTDVQAVSSLSTAGTARAVSSLVNNAVSLTVNSLTSSISQAITNLTNDPIVQTVGSIERESNGWAEATVNGHGYASGTIVTMAAPGCDGAYSGIFSITVMDVNRFKYSVPVGNHGSCAGGTATTTSSIVTATVPGHGFSSGQVVTLAGVLPSGLNGSWSVSVIDPNRFRFSVGTPLGVPTLFGTATGLSLTATGTTAAAHGFAFGDWVTISGASPVGYNGQVTLTSVPTPTTFTYTLASPLSSATGAITVTRGGTTVTATTTTAHGFSSGDQVTLSGTTPVGYSGTYPVTVTGPTTFIYETAVPQPAHTGSGVIASSGVSTTARAVVAGHGFVTGDLVTIAGASPGEYDGTHAITKVDDDTFSYTLATSPAAATGTVTARLSNPTAFATLPGHGYSTGDFVTIRGASPADYNGLFTVTRIDDDRFRYGMGSSPQQTASGTIVAGVTSTTAQATVIAHGFSGGETVTISGASAASFNGSHEITVTDSDHFIYALATPEGDASGNITIEQAGEEGGDSARSDLIDWVRGQDNFEDENLNASSTDVRAMIHNDVLHSKPAVINYNRFGDDHDVMVYYGSNDGIFRAVKGGFQSSPGEPAPGAEVWGFIPPEFFGRLKRLRNNDPIIGSANKKPYFADGSIGTYILDLNNDGILDAEAGDLVYLYISARRGGRLIYALDVSDPENPRFLWKRDSTFSGFTELGYTWSTLEVVTDLAASSNPVLVFGAGYDPTAEDVPPGDITAVSSDAVTAGTAIYQRSMGRGVFMVDALTGEVLWQAGPGRHEADSGTHPYLTVEGMDYSVPSGITIVKNRNGSVRDRGYFGDTGGNVWRIDMADSDVNNWTVTKLAAIADTSDIPNGLRKFLYAPDVVYGSGYDAVLMGSGDREHPMDIQVENRMYMFKDRATGDSAVDEASEPLFPTLTESSLYDVTSNCLEDASGCEMGETAGDVLTFLDSLNGWYFRLAEGEKAVGNAITLNNVTFFNTHQPTSAAAVSQACVSDLGVARAYQVYFQNATVAGDRNMDGLKTAEDRAQIHPGGGFLPPPTPVIVQIDGETVMGVVSGVRVDEPPGVDLGVRIRRFWFKERE